MSSLDTRTFPRGAPELNLIAMRDCAELCRQCADTCLELVGNCVAHSGHDSGSSTNAQHLNLLLDCIDICGSSAASLRRGSPHHGMLCSACAGVALLCATECQKRGGDERMVRCAQICARCAEKCQRMAAESPPRPVVPVTPVL
ncbi:MAG: four-helix bundle copper-binding protein [Phycisphaerae bacterium]|nr:four-helix bundle copper-binding protein [Phycisphaerae bacterium]